MGVFDRMGRVIQSNLNSLLDKVEDDKKLIELNLDEMESQIKAGLQEIVQAMAAEKQLRKRVDELALDVERWDKRAELALKSGDEALAREALKQKKRLAGDRDSAERAFTEQGEAASRMKEEIARMKEKLADLRLRKSNIVTRASRARGAAGAEDLGARGKTSAFDNFRRMEEKIEGREAEGSAMAEVEATLSGGRDNDDLEAKFRKLERDSRGDGKATSAGSASGDVEDELAALKKRIRI